MTMFNAKTFPLLPNPSTEGEILIFQDNKMWRTPFTTFEEEMDTLTPESGVLTINGKVIVSDTTDSTTKDTGSITTEGGIGVEKAIVAGTSIKATTRLFTGAGTVSAPGLVVGTNDNGQYEISSTQQGFSIGNTLVGGYNSTGLFTNNITELTTGAGITLAKNIIKQNTLTALNTTGTITAAIINKGGITSTSAAGVTATLDTAANIATQISAVNGTTIEFIVDNTAGANTVTVAVAAGITVCSGVLTGSDTLTVSVANAIGIFKLVFSSATTAKLYRVG